MKEQWQEAKEVERRREKEKRKERGEFLAALREIAGARKELFVYKSIVKVFTKSWGMK